MDVLLTAGGAAGWGLALAAAAVALVVVTWRTARPQGEPLPDVNGYLSRYRAMHDGYDPRQGSVWVRGWLLTVYRLAHPLARAGVAPDVLSAWSVWAALGVLALASAGGFWPALAGCLVLLAGVGDSLDGAVAVLTSRATRWGYVLDSAVDRGNDVLFAVALVVVGAPPWLVLVAVVLFFELEYIRARAGNAGGNPVGTITVGERASRVAFCGAGLFVAGLFPQRAAMVATAALVVLVVFSAAGVVQLVLAVRRELASAGWSGRADEVGDDGRREDDQGHSAARM